MIDPPYPRLDTDLHRKLCDVLLEIRLRFPDLRLGQLVSNLAWDAETTTPVIEDWDLLAVAERYLEHHKDRIPDVGPLARSASAAPSPDAA
jgi:hypothetical protein